MLRPAVTAMLCQLGAAFLRGAGTSTKIILPLEDVDLDAGFAPLFYQCEEGLSKFFKLTTAPEQCWETCAPRAPAGFSTDTLDCGEDGYVYWTTEHVSIDVTADVYLLVM